jgi:beta-phosphoglucomutase family hydrolase
VNQGAGASGESFDWLAFDAVLFDLDGVITPTADIHRHAWGELFAEHDFTDDDYLGHVDGKPRYDGVRSFLAARGLSLPEGDPSDPPGPSTICAMGNRKNALFNELLERDGIAPYPSSAVTLDLLAAASIPAAVVSSSKNARVVLAAAGLADRFEVVIDGIVAVERHIAGKPAPDMFLTAAADLGVPAGRAVVVEDAVSGVAAGAAGGFTVIGVDRGAGHDALREHGADIVVDDLAELLPSSTPGR